MSTTPTGLRLRPIVLAILPMLGAGPLLAHAAQDDEAGSLAPLTQLAPVTVIGITPLPGLAVDRDRIPGNVQSATATDIADSHAIDLTEYLNRRLGSVFVNEIQNNPFQPDVNYRGYTASPLLGTQQGLSVYLDGVRLNQPFGDVVSWDLIPKSAISAITLVPGSNPLYGLNSLGGALSVQTKNGLRDPGSSVQLQGGTFGRASLEVETGGSDRASGLNWFLTGNVFHDDGWREESPTDVGQLFGKVGWKRDDTDLSLTVAYADTDLNGNGLQEQRFLARDRASVYTTPDNTKNRSWFVNQAFSQGLSEGLSLTGNAYYRHIRTKTFNGDINDDSFDQSLYQPNAAERAALAAAGFTGFPLAGENAGNAPFPFWRCIANALLRDEPAEICTGVINQTATRQSNYGFATQLNLDGAAFGIRHQSVAGVAVDLSRSQFDQSSELGYLNPDRSITGVGAFGDGVTGGDVDGEPYDTRVDLAGRSNTYSAYLTTILTLTEGLDLTASGRYNHTRIRNRDGIIPGGEPGSLDGKQSFSRFNPAVGLTWSPLRALNLYAGWNQGSRAPSSIELGCADPANPCRLPNSFAGDPPLDQVVTTTIEAGVRGSVPGRYQWNAGVFRSDNRDDLLFVADDAAGFGYFRNFGKTRRQGVEAGASGQFFDRLTLGFNYTFLDATYRSSEVLDGSSNSSNEAAEDGFPGVEGTIEVGRGDRIPLVPRQILKVFTDVDLFRWWSIGADVTAVGGSLARGNENGEHEADGVYYLGPGRSAGYAVVNLNTEFRPAAGIKLFVQVNNLLDQRYSTAAQLGATGFNDAGNLEGRPFPADANGDRPVRHATFYAPGAPRYVIAGVRYSFGGKR